MVDRLILDLVAKIDGASSNADLQKFLANAQRVLSKPIRLNIEIGRTAQTLAQINQLAKSLNDANAATKAAAPVLQSASRQYNNLYKQTLLADSCLRRFSTSTKTADTALVKSSQAANTAASGMEQFGRQAAISIRRYSGFVFASRIVFGFGQAVQNALGSAIQFNRELLKVGQVLDIPISGLTTLSRTLNELAVDFAAPADELIKAARIFSQAGFSLAETQQAIAALAPTSLAPTFGDLSQTADGALAILKQFNIETSELAGVFDNLNEVAAKFPVEVTDIFTGISRAGAVFSAASGVTDGLKDSQEALAEFIALFTTVRATTRQSAERIGTGLRTIFTRIQRPRIIEQLRELNIELTNLDGTFVGGFEAIRRLNVGLADLSANDPRFIEILQDISGLRQIEKILPLIQRFDIAQDALRVGLTATGSVAGDVDEAMDNLAVRFQQVVEQVGVLAREVVSSDTFDILAKSALNFSEALIQVLRALEPILPILAAVGAFRFARGAAGFGRGFFDTFASGRASFSDGGRTRLATGGKVRTLLTPGERVFSPQAVIREGVSNLNKLNNLGNASNIKSFAGSFIVPGRGNTDSVPMDLPPGSFVVQKRNALADEIGFGSGGITRRRRRRFQDGGQVGPVENFQDFQRRRREAERAARQAALTARIESDNQRLAQEQAELKQRRIQNAARIEDKTQRQEDEFRRQQLIRSRLQPVAGSGRRLQDPQTDQFVSRARADDIFRQNREVARIQQQREVGELANERRRQNFAREENRVLREQRLDRQAQAARREIQTQGTTRLLEDRRAEVVRGLRARQILRRERVDPFVPPVSSTQRLIDRNAAILFASGRSPSFGDARTQSTQAVLNRLSRRPPPITSFPRRIFDTILGRPPGGGPPGGGGPPSGGRFGGLGRLGRLGGNLNLGLFAAATAAQLLPDAQNRVGAAGQGALQSGLAGAAAGTLFGPVGIAIGGFVGALGGASRASEEFADNLRQVELTELGQQLEFSLNQGFDPDKVNEILTNTFSRIDSPITPSFLTENLINPLIASRRSVGVQERRGVSETVLAQERRVVTATQRAGLTQSFVANALDNLSALNPFGQRGPTTLTREGAFSGAGAGVGNINRLVRTQESARVQEIRNAVLAAGGARLPQEIEQFLRRNVTETTDSQSILRQFGDETVRAFGIALGATGRDEGQLDRNAFFGGQQGIRDLVERLQAEQKLTAQLASLTTVTTLTTAAFENLNTDLQNAVTDFQRLPVAISNIVNLGSNVPRLTTRSGLSEFGNFADNTGLQTLFNQNQIVQNARSEIQRSLTSSISRGQSDPEVAAGLRQALQRVDFGSLPEAITEPVSQAIEQLEDTGAFDLDINAIGAPIETALTNVASSLNTGAQIVSAALTERAKLESEIVNLGVQNLNAQQNFRERLQTALGENIFDLREVLSDRARSITALSPTGPVLGNIQQFDPVGTIVNERNQLLNQRLRIERGQTGAQQRDTSREETQRLLAENTRQLQENSNQLNFLSNDTKSLTAVQQRISAIQQERSQALGFATRLTTATPEQRRDIFRADNALDAVLSGARISAPSAALITRELIPNITSQVIDQLNDQFNTNIRNIEDLQQRVNVAGGINNLIPDGTVAIGAIARLGQSRPGVLPEEQQLIGALQTLEDQRQRANAALVANLDQQITRIDEQLKINTANFVTAIDTAVAQSAGFAELGRIANALGTIPENIQVTFPAPVELNVNLNGPAFIQDLTPALQTIIGTEIQLALENGVRPRGDTP